MRLTIEYTKAGIESFFRLCALHSQIGVSLKDVVEGAAIPEGWELDPTTYYYLPKNIEFLDLRR